MFFVLWYICSDLIDRCTRWHAAWLVQSKEDQSLFDALGTLLVGVHGPVQELVMEGETGLVSSGVAKQYYDRHGIMFVPSAK